MYEKLEIDLRETFFFQGKEWFSENQNNEKKRNQFTDTVSH